MGETSFTVKASLWSDLTLDYEDVEQIEYRETSVAGERTGGFGSAKLLMGAFRNEEFGAYTRYTYTGDAPCIVLTVDGKKVVVGLQDARQTRSLYDEITKRIGQ